MKRKLIMTTIVVIIIVMSAISIFANGDLDDRIQFLIDNEYISGNDSGDLNLDKNITRAEFATILVNAKGLENRAKSQQTSTNDFKDVSSSHWANGYITVVSNLGLMKGNNAGDFSPNGEITYAEAITSLVRLLESNTSQYDKNWPKAYVDRADELGITEDVDVKMNSKASRNDVFLMVSNAISIQTNNIKASDESQSSKNLVKILNVKEMIFLKNNSDSTKPTRAISHNTISSDYVGEEAWLIEYIEDVTNKKFNSNLTEKDIQSITEVVISKEITGSIPSEIENLTQLKKISITGNSKSGLSGEIPNSISNLKHLQILDLSSNNLSGNIPNLSGLTKLKEINLSNNSLTGTIPETLVKLPNIKLINLSDNALAGTIPTQMINIKNMTMFEVKNNQLEGQLPSELQERAMSGELKLDVTGNKKIK